MRWKTQSTAFRCGCRCVQTARTTPRMFRVRCQAADTAKQVPKIPGLPVLGAIDRLNINQVGCRPRPKGQLHLHYDYCLLTSAQLEAPRGAMIC